MTTDLKIIVEPIFTADLSTEQINEKINEISSKLENINLNIDGFKNLTDSFKQINESKLRMIRILNEHYSNVDAEKFLNALIFSPVSMNTIGFNNIIKFLEFANKLRTQRNVGQSNIPASLTVNVPQVDENTIEVSAASYFDFLNVKIFPILFFLISQYQVYDSNQQMDKMQNQMNQIIEEYEKLKQDQPLNIELPADFSGGDRV